MFILEMQVRLPQNTYLGTGLCAYTMKWIISWPRRTEAFLTLKGILVTDEIGARRAPTGTNSSEYLEVDILSNMAVLK